MSDWVFDNFGKLILLFIACMIFLAIGGAACHEVGTRRCNARGGYYTDGQCVTTPGLVIVKP